jgi:undecaprenyl-diphosphatase
MSLLQLIILAIIQGITEFLPISSSAHLALVPAVSEWPDQGLLNDVAVHVGTLFAVIIYFHRDVGRLIGGGFANLSFGEKRHSRNAKMFRLLVLASIPVFAVGGFMAYAGYEEYFRDPKIIAIASIVFGLVLYVADKAGLRVRTLSDLSGGHALTIGLAQVLALIPGTSRAGITMTAARMLGFERVEAARFSMLLSIPVILAAGGWGAYEIITSGTEGTLWFAGIAALASFLMAIASIHFLMKWLERASMTIFVVYRVALGIVILVWLMA